MANSYKYYPFVLRQIRLFVILILLFGVSSLSRAATVKWTILPEYDILEPYCEGIYKYADHATIGLIDESGTVIEGSQCDSIMPANADGLALLLQNPGNSEATLVGIFNSKKRQVILVEGDFKVNIDVAFFNDDRLPVCDGDGNWGYLGIDGRIAIPCQYKQAGPFSFQLAPVRLNNDVKNVVYIKSDGTRITVGVNRGIISGGSPVFKDGTADVVFNGKYWRITSKGKLKNKITQSGYRSMEDWLSEYGQSMTENADVSPVGAAVMQAFLDSHEGQIIDGQVNLISTHGDQAIVGYKGKVGLLQLVQGDFGMEMAASQVTVKDQKVDPQVLKMDVLIPEGIDAQELGFYINDYSTEPTPKGNGAQELQFKTSDYAGLTSSKTEVINVGVRDRLGLLLFTGEGKVNITYKKLEPKPELCQTCGLEKNKCKHKGKHKLCNKCHKIIDKNHRVADRCTKDGGKHKEPKHPDPLRPTPPPT